MNNHNNKPKRGLVEMMTLINPNFKPNKLLIESEQNWMNDNNNLSLTDYDKDSIFFKKITDKLKSVIDDLYNEQDYTTLNTLYALLVKRSKGINEVLDLNNYEKKAELMKGKIDFLYDNHHYELLDKLDGIINNIFPTDDNDLNQ